MMRACSKLWSIAAIGLALLPAPLRAEFIYVANFLSNDVSAYCVGENGTLRPVAGSPFSTGFPAGQTYTSSVAVDPLHRVVYVTNTGDASALGSHGSVSAFRIGADGALTAVPGSPFTAENYSSSVTVDVLRRFVYVANAGDPAFNGNTVSAYRIRANGALMPVPGSPFPTGDVPASLAVDLWGQFLYVANALSNTISAYRIGVDGALTPVGRSPFSTGIEPESVAVDILGRFIYTANFGITSPGSVSAYRINANGALTSIPGSPFTAGFTANSDPESVAVDPWGRFAYVANHGTNLLSAYRIGENGTLTPVPKSPFPTGNSPASVLVDLTGRFVYVANGYLGNSVSAYRISANGTLAPVLGAPFTAGDEPNSMAVAP